MNQENAFSRNKDNLEWSGSLYTEILKEHFVEPEIPSWILFYHPTVLYCLNSKYNLLIMTQDIWFWQIFLCAAATNKYGPASTNMNPMWDNWMAA
jgi:hypothetical protein